MQPDSAVPSFAAHLAAVRRRLIARHAVQAAAAGFVMAAAICLVLRGSGAPGAVYASVGVVGGGLAAGWMWYGRRHARSSRAAAAAIERVHPESRNLVITAEELVAHPQRTEPWMRERVIRDAAALVRETSPASDVPLGRAVAMLAGAALAMPLVFVDMPARSARVLRDTVQQLSERVAAAESLTVVATVQPPAYTSLAEETIRQPERLGVVEGTVIRLTISGGRSPWRVRFGEATLPVATEQDRTVASLTPTESGYFAIAAGEGTEAAPRMLIPVTVIPDRAPVIKVEEPGKDLLVPDRNRSVRVRASAVDDYGLRALSLRYTRVSGSGEQFEFVEGELPFTVARDDSRHWSGHGELDLRTLGLDPGDSLVYRVVSRDRRPGDAGLASSDTFFIEVAGPGQVALEGFEMPPDQERYALSQQMIVLKIQRLRAREPRLARDALQEATGGIAGEQRSVRANFVFLMGGHVEDEEEEAAHSNEIQEGRLENTARQEIARAVGHMSYAEQALVAVDTASALKQARLAVDALQRAFGRNRYLLRALPVRSRIDPSRRLSGTLAEAGDWGRSLAAAGIEKQALATRELLSALLDLAPAITVTTRDRGVGGALTRLAEQALGVDPASVEWQQIATRLLALRDAAVGGHATSDLERQLRDVIAPVVAVARRQAAEVRRADLIVPSALRGAWADEMRSK